MALAAASAPAGARKASTPPRATSMPTAIALLLSHTYSGADGGGSGGSCAATHAASAATKSNRECIVNSETIARR